MPARNRIADILAVVLLVAGWSVAVASLTLANHWLRLTFKPPAWLDLTMLGLGGLLLTLIFLGMGIELFKRLPGRGGAPSGKTPHMPPRVWPAASDKLWPAAKAKAHDLTAAMRDLTAASRTRFFDKKSQAGLAIAEPRPGPLSTDLAADFALQEAPPAAPAYDKPPERIPVFQLLQTPAGQPQPEAPLSLSLQLVLGDEQLSLEDGLPTLSFTRASEREDLTMERNALRQIVAIPASQIGLQPQGEDKSFEGPPAAATGAAPFGAFLTIIVAGNGRAGHWTFGFPSRIGREHLTAMAQNLDGSLPEPEKAEALHNAALFILRGADKAMNEFPQAHAGRSFAAFVSFLCRPGLDIPAGAHALALAEMTAIRLRSYAGLRLSQDSQPSNTSRHDE